MTDLELLNRILVQFKIRANSPRDSKGRVVSIGGGSLGGAKATTKSPETKAVAPQQAKAQATAAAKPKAPAGSQTKARAGGGAITHDEIREAVKGKGLTERYEAIADLVRSRQSTTPVTGAFGGMSAPETFHSVEFDGVKYHYAAPPTGTAPKSSVTPITQTLNGLSEGPPIPKGIAQHTKNVYLTGQTNSHDAHWEKAYNMPGFRTAATGGNGDVVVYHGKPGSLDLVAHEMGHNWAQAAYGSYEPMPMSRYTAAIRSGESPVSDYARSSHAEDFAEATMKFVTQPAAMKQAAPQRYKALEDLLRGKY